MSVPIPQRTGRFERCGETTVWRSKARAEQEKACKGNCEKTGTSLAHNLIHLCWLIHRARTLATFGVYGLYLALYGTL